MTALSEKGFTECQDPTRITDRQNGTVAMDQKQAI
jgi:hypothetical protein